VVPSLDVEIVGGSASEPTTVVWNVIIFLTRLNSSEGFQVPL
jgi:hypothetical protein